MNESEEVVRVIAYVPVRSNQLLQAHASLEGKAKQTLIGEILTAHAETLEVARINEKKERKPTKRKARKTASNKRNLETTE